MKLHLSSGFEKRIGGDGLISELREGRLGGPPRSRGRPGFWCLWESGNDVAAFAHPPSFLYMDSFIIATPKEIFWRRKADANVYTANEWVANPAQDASAPTCLIAQAACSQWNEQALVGWSDLLLNNLHGWQKSV